MGEIQEQRYVCKICEKSCVSGKSLGGHMRVHLAVIAASKQAAKAKAKAKSKIKMEIDCSDDDDRDSSYPIEENVEKYKDFGDGDQNNSYELRDNPKRSWRISDSISKKEVSCKECGKEFPSSRALSGHMRSHSIKKKMNICKTCGKDFDSLRAMFGHMKSHSKKSRVNDDSAVSADSLSDWDNLNSVRRKRSRIRYKINPNPSFTSLNASSCVASDLGEVQEAANCLMLLSRGVRDAAFDSVKESSDDDSAYFGSKSGFKSMELAGNGGDLVSDSGKKTWRLENCSSVFAAEVEIKVDYGVSEQVSESNVEFDCADDSCMKASVCDHDSVLDKNCSRNDANGVEISKGSENKYRCRTCDKLFTSKRTLSAHIGRHKTKGDIDADLNLDEIKQESGDMGVVSLELSKSKEHECPVCFKVFSSGQALGGHKRAHYTGFVTEINTREAMSVNHEVSDVNDLFDLNFPRKVDGGDKSNFWWAQSGNEHEPLVLTT